MIMADWIALMQRLGVTMCVIGLLIQPLLGGWASGDKKLVTFTGSCGLWNPCTQMCINLKNGYECLCYRGYTLHIDGTSCYRDQGNSDSTTSSPSQLQRHRFPNIYRTGESRYPAYNPVYYSAPPPSVAPSDGWQNDAPMYVLAPSTKETHNSSSETMKNEWISDIDDDNDERMDSKSGRRKGKGRKNRNKGRKNKTNTGQVQNDDSSVVPEKTQKMKGMDGNNEVIVEGTTENKMATQDSMVAQDKMVPNGKMASQDKMATQDMSATQGKMATVQDKMTMQDKMATQNKMAAQPCDELKCQNGGSCVGESRAGVRCSCRLGTTGRLCEEEMTVRYPQFQGTGYLALPALRAAYRELHIEMVFRPTGTEGLLMFSADRIQGMADYFAIVLKKGHLEFRFDCGTGPAVLTSPNGVILDEWNSLKIYRKDREGMLTLNNGTTQTGVSKGLFTRLSLHLDTFLGGYDNLSIISEVVGVSQGFSGCVKTVVLNHRDMDMRKGTYTGDALYGVDVGECSVNLCATVHCLNGGRCRTTGPDSAVCMCPVGTAGGRCEQKVDIFVPVFDGTSYLQLLGLQRRTLMFTEIEMVIKPTHDTGLIFYNGYRTDGTGDFISLALSNGYVEFRFELGTGPAVIRGLHPLTLNSWHTIRASRTGRDGWLQIDHDGAVLGSSPGSFTQLTLNLDLFIGGHRNIDELAKGVGVQSFFQGCIQKLTINDQPVDVMDEYITGMNIANCPHPCLGQPCLNGGRCVAVQELYKCNCPLGFDSLNCELRTERFRYRFRREVMSPVTIPMFTGDSYLMYNEPFISKRFKGLRLSLSLHLRIMGPDGLILWLGEDPMGPSSDFLALGLTAGHLILRYNLGSGEVLITTDATDIIDGNWHTISIRRYQKTGFLQIDNGKISEGTSPGTLQQLNVDNKLYLGGMPTADIAAMTQGRFTRGFHGCISELLIDKDVPVLLMEQVSDGENITQCK